MKFDEIMIVLQLIVSIFTGVITFLMFKILIKRLPLHYEVYYKDTADTKYEKMKHLLTDNLKDEDHEYDGSNNRRFNQLKIERCVDEFIIEPKFKGSTQKVSYYTKNDKGKKWVKTWYLK